ncbi:MAG: hypothetical protein K0Q73_8864, partial [Paenibacillus sp.]|nr:hypothetical protein [Paenibacillus sp.]
RIVETGELMPIAGLITPPVTANTPTEAMAHEDTINYCTLNKCCVYRVVK